MAVEVAVERREVIPVRIPMAGGGAHLAILLVLHAGGLTGLGEAPVVAGRGADLSSVASELAGDGGPRSGPAQAAWESAMLDLEGKNAGVTVAELLGGARRDGVDCNALVAAAAPGMVAAEVEGWARRGFRTFKLKSANRGGPVDMERLGAARWAAGPTGLLRLDLNGRLSVTEAATVLPSLAGYRLEHVEQPLPAATPAGEWRRLAQASGVDLAADESLADPRLAGELAAAGVGLAVKLATVGGLRAALALAGGARGPVLLASSYDTSVGLAAALHLACALESRPPACGLATGGLLESDPAAGLQWDGARLLLPAAAGLGVELDRGVLERYRIDR